VKKPSLSFLNLAGADELEADMGGFKEGKMKSANEESLEGGREVSWSKGNCTGSSFELV
jgi:hypothetical protein